MFEGQKMVTISQVADACSRSHELVRLAVAKGELPAHRRGKMYRIAPSAAEKWIAERYATAKPIAVEGKPADGAGIQIDSGVPIPRISRAGRPKSEHRRALEIMQVGQSFMFDDGVRGAVLNASGTVSRAMKRKFTARRHQGGFRIWRVA